MAATHGIEAIRSHIRSRIQEKVKTIITDEANVAAERVKARVQALAGDVALDIGEMVSNRDLVPQINIIVRTPEGA